MSQFQVNNACVLLMCVQACFTSTSVPVALTDWLSVIPCRAEVALHLPGNLNTRAVWQSCLRAAPSLWCITRHAQVCADQPSRKMIIGLAG